MKKHFAKIVAFVLVVMLAVVLLAACGRNEDPDEDYYPPDTGTEEDPYTPDPGTDPGGYTPDPIPEPDRPVATVPILSNLRDAGLTYVLDGNNIYIGWDGIDTVFMRAEGATAASVSFSLNLPTGGLYIWNLGQVGAAAEAEINLSMEQLYYINSHGINASVFVGSPADESILVGFQQAAMSALRFPVVSGFNNFGDVPSHYISHNHEGNSAIFRHSVQVAWNGFDTAFVRFTVHHGHGEIFNSQSADTSVWWEDDIVEVFMVPFLPADEEENRREVRHWASNVNHAFTMPGGSFMFANHTGMVDNRWTADLALQLDSEMIGAIIENGHVYGKLSVALYSNEEWMLLGTTGSFWGADNYHRFVFEPGAATTAELLELLEVKRYIASKQKFYAP